MVQCTASRQKGAAARQPQRRGALVYLLYLGMLAWLAWHRMGQLWPALVVPASAFVVGTLVRKLIDRPRPYTALGFTPLFPKDKTGQSMPSRHCFSAAAIAGTAWYVLPPLGAVLAVLGVLIAISRVVTGVHYISDVLAGLAFGSVFAVLGWNAFVLAASALGFTPLCYYKKEQTYEKMDRCGPRRADSLTLTGCSFQDVMLYLYGGDSFVTSAEPDYTTCDGDNGVTVVYDQNQWEQPVMAQDDTLSLTTGNQLSYTVVLLQTTDTYTDFLAQSGQELEETTGTVRYDIGFTVPDAAVSAVRYDCGSYQTIFAQIDYDCGETIYVTAAARTQDYEPIIALFAERLAHRPCPRKTPRTADKTTKAVTEDDVNGGRSKSLA